MMRIQFDIRLNALLLIFLVAGSLAHAEEQRPNILFFFADDWGRYASIYANADKPSLNDVISTPNIDRIGREGVVFKNAFVPVVSCGPCRASLATGRYFWNCGSGAFLNGKASNWKGHDNPMQSLPKFGDLIRESGYYAQASRKTFAFARSPLPKSVCSLGKVGYERYGLYVGAAKNQAERKSRHDEIVENCRQEIQRVLGGRADKQPFFFVFGSINVGGSGGGEFQLVLGYASGGGASCSLVVNGVTRSTLLLPKTGGWQVYKAVKLTVTLEPGKNRMEFRSHGRGGVNLDSLDLKWLK